MADAGRDVVVEGEDALLPVPIDGPHLSVETVLVREPGNALPLTKDGDSRAVVGERPPGKAVADVQQRKTQGSLHRLLMQCKRERVLFALKGLAVPIPVRRERGDAGAPSAHGLLYLAKHQLACA